MLRRRAAWTVAAALSTILAASPSAGQPALPADAVVGWHIVRGGDNLIRITESYLGTADRWREIWRLNPELDDPHLLVPGQRIRVFLQPEKSVPAARLQTVSGRVEDKANPLPWSDAVEQDLLVERDGIRTFRSSSTEMRFPDGSQVLLTEDSLVFVRRSETPERERAASKRRTVEIVAGQADVAIAVAESPIEVEIVVGGATARPRPEGAEAGQTRARKGRTGAAELMVYEGSTQVEAAGERLEVPTGMGTAVPEGGPPSPPEKLLPAPRQLAPAAGSEWPLPDPRFAWEPVEGAVSYTVEICRDPACAALVRRLTDLRTAGVQPEPLPVAALFWRVTAVSTSGLDGFPSPASTFSILSDRLDEHPPVGRVVLASPGVRVADRTLHDGAVAVRVDADDDGSGVAGWTASVNGEPVESETLSGGWATGSYLVEVSAVDRAGNTGRLEPLRFEVDADPPRIEVTVAWVAPLLREVRPAVATPRWLRRKRRFAEWAYRRGGGAAARGFLVLAAGSDSRPIVDSYRQEPFDRDPSRLVRQLRVEGNHPQAMVLAPGVAPAEGEPLSDGRFLWVRAADAASGVVEWLEVRSGEGHLVIEAADPLGHRARLSLPYR